MIKIVVFSGNKYNLMKTIPAVVIFRPGHQQTVSLTPLPSLQSSTPDHVSDRIPVIHRACVYFLRVANARIGAYLNQDITYSP